MFDAFSAPRRNHEFSCQIIVAFLTAVSLAACDLRSDRVRATPEDVVIEAVGSVGLDRTALSVPKLGGMLVSPAARLPIVDRLMSDPLELRTLTEQLLAPRATATGAEFLASRFEALGLKMNSYGGEIDPVASMDRAWHDADAVGVRSGKRVQSRLSGNAATSRVVAPLLVTATTVAKRHRDAFAISDRQWDGISRDLARLIEYRGDEQNERWITRNSFHAISPKPELKEIAGNLLRLVRALENVDVRSAAVDEWTPGEWQTPLGRVRIGTRGVDRYEGEYFAILDPGGNDSYLDVAAPLRTGAVLLVLDLAGDDRVAWAKRAGPGAALFGFSVWIDVSGDDVYRGGNLGAGAAIYGGGLLWDRDGNDRYAGGSQMQGAANYGVAVLWDEKGNDRYEAGMSGQGFGGPAGIGMLIDAGGDDEYVCGGLTPDRAPARLARHPGTHYLSMCQGYGFGFRPDVSGGLGVLLDQGGNDAYESDLFGQGAGFWFGVGILGDLKGDDRYQAFEHCQGESVHLGAGFLGDWAGNDRYAGVEHCQGVGVDRGAGFLYDEAGDDSYSATRDSQGAGLKAYAVGLLWDRSGRDQYTSRESSQGYSALVDPIPDGQWPVGILVDEGEGSDTFELPNVKSPGRRARIQNKQGVAVAR